MALRLSESGKMLVNENGKLTCTCCECPQPAVQWDSRSASKSKCGVNMGTDGCSPPRYFLYSEFITAIGSTEKDCSLTGEALGQASNCGGAFTSTIRYIADAAVSCDVIETAGSAQAGPGCRWHYTSEYATAALISNTEAALPAFDDDWDDTPGSYRNLTTNEDTYSIREGKYRIAYTVPAPGACYRIEWTEGSTPKTWEWDGTGTTGETAYTPEVIVPIPEANETVTVTDVVAYCTGCSE